MPAKLTKQEKQALKQKQKEEFELRLKTDRLDKELQATRGQTSEVRRKVFEQAQLINLPIIKEEWLHKWGYFERTIDWKDFYISQLRDDIFYFELHHRLLEQKHNENTDALLEIYREGIERVMNTYNIEQSKLIRERERQETRLVLKQERKKENMEAILLRLGEERQQEMESTLWDNQKERQLKIFRYEEAVMRIAQGGDEEVKELWAAMKSIFDRYKSATSKKRQEYLIMKQRDLTEKSSLDLLSKRMVSLHRKVRQCRGRLSKLKLDEGIREEVELRRASLEQMKQETRACNEQDMKQLENLSVSSTAALQKLVKILAKMTEAISLVSIVRKLETNEEKVAPKLFTNPPLSLFKNTVLPMFDDLEHLWAKTMHVSKTKDHISGELQRLELENIKLQRRLKAIFSEPPPC